MSKRERIEALEARVAALEASNAAGGRDDEACEAVHASGLACTLDLDHDGQHVATGGPAMVLQTWTDPEPVPQWRALVDEYAEEDPGESRAELGYALNLLAEIASGENWRRPYGELAQLTAIAERQVGDGWKADPDNWDRDWDDHVDIWIMLDALCVTEQKWQAVGDRAAAWLRSLLDGAS